MRAESILSTEDLFYKQVCGTSMKSRILIADDHPLMRGGLAQLVNSQEDMVTCYEAHNAETVLEGVFQTEPDLILTDFALPDKNGIELVKDICAVRPKLPILVISMHEESLYANRVLRAGARGYIAKTADASTLLSAMRQILSGKIYASEGASARILEIFSGNRKRSENSMVEELSDREFEIFELVGNGFSTKQIADYLSLSIKTVDAHRANIKVKLKITTTSKLIAFAACWRDSMKNSGGGLLSR